MTLRRTISAQAESLLMPPMCEELERRLMWSVSGVIFHHALTFQEGEAQEIFATADFTGDQNKDLVFANGDTISVLLGNGNGTFQSPLTTPLNGDPDAIAVGDFTGDGKPDVAVTYGQTLGILLGNGNGTFKQPLTMALGSKCNAITVADLNGDGKTDLILNQDDALEILLSNGDGTFRESSIVPGDIYQSVAVGDFNGDGREDIALAGYGRGVSPSVSILLGNGNGTFAPGTTFSVPIAPVQIVAGDFNNDGKADLVILSLGSYFDLLLGNGDGTFQTGTATTLPNEAFSMAEGDFNGDGNADLAVVGVDSLLILLGNGNGTFVDQIINQTVGNTGDETGPIVVGNFYNNGRQDFVTGDNSSILTGDYEILWKNVITLATPTPESPMSNSGGQTPTPTLTWSAVNNATGYEVAIGTSSTQISQAYQTDSTSTQYQLSAPLKPGNYYWEVEAQDGIRSGVWSIPVEFTVAPLLAAPTLLSPGNASTANINPTTFTWSSVSGAMAYRIVVAEYPFPADHSETNGGIVVDTDVTSPDYTVPTGLLQNGVNYYWEVIGISSSAGGTWSSVQMFMPGLAAATLFQPNQYSPLTRRPQLAWEPVAGATSYRLVVASDKADLNVGTDPSEDGAGVVIDQIVAGTTFTPSTPLSRDTTYYWEVMALGSDLEGPWSTDSFATPAPVGPASSGYSVSQIKQAYGLNNVSLTGVAQTIAIVDAYNDPDIESDLANFDQQFNLNAPPSFTVLNAKGDPITPSVEGAPPPNNERWVSEIDLDVEWIHALAPDASIVLVEALNGNLDPAINTARNYSGVSVVSMSFSAAAGSMTSSLFTTPAGHVPVTFVSSSGDTGQYPSVTDSSGNVVPGPTAGVNYPAGFPNVLAVGATTLDTYRASGLWGSETLWNESPTSGSGRGVSTTEPLPAYQQGVISAAGRRVPDVAFDGDPSTGVTVYDSYDAQLQNTIDDSEELGGTSLSAPAWAAIVALIDQGRMAQGKATLGNQDIQDLLYSLPSTDFHKTGSNDYNAGTGLGTPIANLLIPDAINDAVPNPAAMNLQPGNASDAVFGLENMDASFVAGDAGDASLSAWRRLQEVD